jgi:hypothetical protein
MSVRTNAIGDDLRRSANLPSSTSFTVCGWTTVVTDGGGGFQCLASLRSATAYISLYWDYNDNTMRLDANGTTTNFASRPAAGVPFFWAITCSGTGANTFNGYWARASDTSFVTAARAGVSVATPTVLAFHNYANSDWLDGNLSFVRCFDAVLTSAELWAEMWSPIRQRLTNINFDVRLQDLNDFVDLSGNGRNLTVTGTVTTADAPPIVRYVPRLQEFNPNAAAAGGAITGSIALSITPIGVLTGNGALVGSVALTLTPSGALTGTGALTGNVPLAISVTSALTGTGALAGTVALAVGVSGTLVNGASGDMTGSVPMTLDVIGALTGNGALTGTVSLTLDVSGIPNGIVTITESFSGGFFVDFERHMRRRDDGRRKREEDEEQAQAIADTTAREIAAFLHAQEARDAERAEIERLRSLVRQYADLQAQEAFTERVWQAFSRAVSQENASALLAFEREMTRMLEEEELLLFALAYDL